MELVNLTFTHVSYLYRYKLNNYLHGDIFQGEEARVDRCN